MGKQEQPGEWYSTAMLTFPTSGAYPAKIQQADLEFARACQAFACGAAIGTRLVRPMQAMGRSSAEPLGATGPRHATPDTSTVGQAPLVGRLLALGLTRTSMAGRTPPDLVFCLSRCRASHGPDRLVILPRGAAFSRVVGASLRRVAGRRGGLLLGGKSGLVARRNAPPGSAAPLLACSVGGATVTGCSPQLRSRPRAPCRRVTAEGVHTGTPAPP